MPTRFFGVFALPIRSAYPWMNRNPSSVGKGNVGADLMTPGGDDSMSFLRKARRMANLR